MQPYVQQAELTLPNDEDEPGPGGAITLALCGSWEHPPPCPLAPHQTAVERSRDDIRLRIVFACRPVDEAHVRQLIEDALANGHQAGPDGIERTWAMVSSGPGTLRPDERELAARLAGG